MPLTTHEHVPSAIKTMKQSEFVNNSVAQTCLLGFLGSKPAYDDPNPLGEGIWGGYASAKQIFSPQNRNCCC
jgi:hypothetical protein